MNEAIPNYWYEAAANEPVVTFVTHFAADRLNRERQAAEDTEFNEWIRELKTP